MDVAAIKPGNVGWHGGNGSMTSHDFLRSATACGWALCALQQSLGKRILHAVQQTHQAVGTNTNLGIVLLCAPIVMAALESDDATIHDLSQFRQRVKAVLVAATPQDVADIFAAIRLAQPGGMGEVEENDIRNTPHGHLLDIMRSASGRDRIAAEYANHYALLFETLVPLLLEIYQRWGYYCWAVTGVYLYLLGTCSDTLVHRKYGQDIAYAIRHELEPFAKEVVQSKTPQQFEQKLLLLDRDLKKRGINPGTSADLVVCSFFIARLGKILRLRRID